MSILNLTQLETAAELSNQRSFITPKFDSCTNWVNQWLLDVLRRSTSQTELWCRNWDDHNEAYTRLTTLWQAWEAANHTGDTNDWFVIDLAAQWPEIVSTDGPFNRCHDTHTTDSNPLTSAAPTNPAVNTDNGDEYQTCQAWVDQWLLTVIRRQPTQQSLWCSHWHEHNEAYERFNALWQAWEKAHRAMTTDQKTDYDPTAMSRWFVYSYPNQWHEITSPHGPFRRCENNSHHRNDNPPLASNPQ